MPAVLFRNTFFLKVGYSVSHDRGYINRIEHSLSKASSFEVQSQPSPDAPPIVHAEGEIGLNTLYETPEKTLEELKDLCTRTVPPADVYAAIDGVGLWLGPNFQVAKDVYISGSLGDGDDDVLCRLELNEGVPNNGYVMHPALFDGTIHTLGTHSIGKNVTDLKIFGGAGAAVVHAEGNFSNNSFFWVHLNITETTENDQTFNSTIFDEEGNVLFMLSDVVFRKVMPEQIKTAIKTQRPADAQRAYDSDVFLSPGAFSL